jgi:molybdate-binding protein/DNA-binding XRE family transcriptional regulator
MVSSRAMRGPAPPGERYESRLKSFRAAKGVSQIELAEKVGLTRQAIYMIEAGRYLPNATTALRLARALGCRVEDLFVLEEELPSMEAELLVDSTDRVKLWRAGGRFRALALSARGDASRGLLSADAIVSERRGRSKTALLQPLEDRVVLERQIAVAGCDPALFVIADRLMRAPDPLPVVVWSMGSTDALSELAKETVHIAGVHLRDSSGDFNLPFLRRHFGRKRMTVVTLAFWQMGLVVSSGNRKSIRSIEDLARKGVRIVNRERGSGARQLLDRRLSQAGISARDLAGYDRVFGLHTEVAREVFEGRADAAVAPLAIARLLGLDFVPLETERYDLVMTRGLADEHPSVQRLLEALSTKAVRRELDALGGYDTTHTGELVAPR